MKKKLFILTFCFLAIFSTVSAQHEFSVNAFGGLQPLNLTLSNNGSNSGSFGIGAGVGYNYNFNQNWSIGTGADFSFYNASLKYNKFEDIHIGYDDSGKCDFTFMPKTDAFSEDISALLLEVPLTLRYSLPFGETGNSLRFIGGFKFGFPLNCSYSTSFHNLHAEGTYEFENQTYNFNEVFKMVTTGKHSGSWDAKLSIQLTLEAAYRFAIGTKSGLSVGVYFNYGLNDIQNKKDMHPIAFDVNSSKMYITNSLLNSNFTSSLKPMAVGLKLRFDFGQ